jgi:Ca2+-binding RTX toxin-like protein
VVPATDIAFIARLGDRGDWIKPVTATGCQGCQVDVDGGAGSDTVVGSEEARYSLGGGPGPDTLSGGPLRDGIEGGAGSDIIYGGRGPDWINGDWARSGLLRCGTAPNEGGSDRIHGRDGNDTLRGCGGNDLIRAGGGADVVLGGSRNDTLWGEAGNDTLYARDGRRDALHGGTGHDRARIDRGVDRITSIARLF